MAPILYHQANDLCPEYRDFRYRIRQNDRNIPADEFSAHPLCNGCKPGNRAYGPELFQVPVCCGVSGLPYYGVYRYLRGAGAERGNSRSFGHNRRGMESNGIYRPIVFYHVQNWKPLEIHIRGELTVSVRNSLIKSAYSLIIYKIV